jgi:hypothetical protein
LYYQGFFGFIDSAAVRNLKLTDVSITPWVIWEDFGSQSDMKFQDAPFQAALLAVIMK